VGLTKSLRDVQRKGLAAGVFRGLQASTGRLLRLKGREPNDRTRTLKERKKRGRSYKGGEGSGVVVGRGDLP